MSIAYVSRAIEKPIIKAAGQFPVIVVTGPRQTGKSTLLKALFPRYSYVTLDNPTHRAAAVSDPAMFMENLGTPVIIDEIQYAPGLLPYIKMAVDGNRAKKGRYILTGSQIFPLMAGISESLAGRAALFELLGFSYEELNLAAAESPKDCFKRIYKGFYPDPCVHKIPPQEYYAGYLSTYLERDIRQIKSVHDISTFQAFLQLLAARTGGLLNLSEISKECGISQPTARNWLSLLESTRIVYLLKPYFRNITKRVVKTPKLYFTDTGLLAYLLKYQDAATLLAGPMAGAFFENLVVVEVLKKKFNHRRLFEPYFYRDTNKNEVDLVLDLGQRFIIAEIKMSMNLRPELAKTFRALPAPFNTTESYVVSFARENLALAENVRALAWEKFVGML